MLEGVIRGVPFFATLPPRHLRWLAETLQAQDLLAEAMLFREGEQGDALYIVLQGEFEMTRRLEAGGHEVIGVRGPGEYLGEMSLLHPTGVRTASARALEDSEVLVVTRAQFDALLHRFPPLGYELARVMADRLEHAHALSIQRLEERNRVLQIALDELHAAQAELVEKQMLEHELALARDIQMSLLPPRLPAIPEFDFGARLLPMSQVGGDFYDFIPLDDGRLGIAVGDVSGHGVPAALIMAITLALLRSQSCWGQTPSDVLRTVNAELLKLGTRRMFVTVLYGVLDLGTGEFVYARAGHEPPVISAPGAPPVIAGLARGRLLGLFRDIVLVDDRLGLPPGGSLIFYTDGVIETRNHERAFFGENRLLGLAAQAQSWGAQAVCDSVLAAVAAHGGGLPQQDDITVLCVRRLRPNEPGADGHGG